jgi:fatty acid desaturase
MENTDEPGFSVIAAREIVRDLFEPRMGIYWADFLTTWSVAVACFGLSLSARVPWMLRLACFLASAFAWYRAAAFTHELAHLRGRGVRPFRAAWNLLCGIPLLIPSFLYDTHVDHHSRNSYGTPGDGEYIPWARQPPAGILQFVAMCAVAPFLAVVRFAVLAPLSWASSRLRQAIDARASALVVTAAYVRRAREGDHDLVWSIEEAGCLVYLVAAAALIATGALSVGAAVQAFVMAMFVAVTNALRVLGAHRYRNADGEMSFIEQIADSVTYPGRPALTVLWAPVGLRFHALHHLFPSMPYHALGAAHRRLVARLPPDSPYVRTISPGLWTSLRTLMRESSASRRVNRAAGTGETSELHARTRNVG